jgi:integrase/recombinase XerD
MDFKTYLAQKRLSAATVRHYTRDIDYFLDWLKQEDTGVASFTYNDLLDFMRHCNHVGMSQKRIHALIGVVRHYMNWLIAENKRADNPAAGVFIKGLVRKLPTNILSMEAMEELFKQYGVQLNVDASKKIMLGLMIYQGLTVGEIMRLQSHHINIKE